MGSREMSKYPIPRNFQDKLNWFMYSKRKLFGSLDFLVNHTMTHNITK